MATVLDQVPAWATPTIIRPVFKKLAILAGCSVVLIWFVFLICPPANIEVPKISIDLHSHRPPPSPFNESKVAFLLEDRPIPHLAPLLLHMISVVPPDWRFLFVGSQESIDFVNSSLPVQMHERNGKLDLVLLPENATVKGQEELTITFTSLWFWKWLGGKREWDHRDPYLDELVEKDGRLVRRPQVEWMLVFQTDAIMCAKAKKSLNEYLDYDWVGAPWAMHDRFGGNGGLSLRRLSRIIQVLEFQERAPHTEMEDLWLIQRIGHLWGANMANTTVEAGFSVEQVWQEEPLGYHTGWSGARFPEEVWNQKERRDHIWEYCPEIKLILDMQLKNGPKDDKRRKRWSTRAVDALVGW